MMFVDESGPIEEGTKTEDGNESKRALHRTMSPLQKAEYESALWSEHVRANHKSPLAARGIENLGPVLGVSGYEIRQRFTLHREGAACAPLWQQLEAGSLTMSEAIKLLRHAARAPESYGADLASRIQLLLHQASAKRVPQPEQPWRDPSHPTPMTRSAFMVEVRTLIGALVEHTLVEHDASTRTRLGKSLETDIALAVQAFRQHVRDIVGTDITTVITTALPRKKILDACAVLSMDPPRTGKPADLVLAKKKYRALAHLFHPDVSDAPNAQQVFGNATAAYKTLCDYNLTLEGDSSHVEGGNDRDRP